MQSDPDPSALLLPDVEEERGARRPMLLVSRPWLMVLAQFYPVIALALVYPLVVPELAARAADGTTLAVLLVSCAVITPTLAQAVAAPVFLHLLGEQRADPVFVARTVLRVAVGAVLVVTPLAAAAVLAVAAARHLPVPATAAFFGLLLLHVLMGALMVPAYALRAPVLLVLPWTAYACVLGLVPAAVWAAPSAAIALEVLALIGVAMSRSRSAAPFEHRRVPIGAAFRASLRGAAEGLPLWSIPVVVWLIDLRMESIGFIYVALLPGVLAHQLFFVRVVDPGWRQLETARSALSAEPYRIARAHFDRLVLGLTSGLNQAAGLLVMLSLVLVSAAAVMHWEHGALLLLIVVAAFGAVVAMMQGYVIAMFGSPVPLAVLGSASLVVVGGGVAVHGADVAVLAVASGVYLGFAALAVPIVRRTMHRPEYALFWRGALAS